MRKKSQAFTRIELVAVIAALAFLGALALPLLATTRADSERLVCFNNLRLIGRGVQIWAGDHNQRFPWRTPTTEGGEFIFQGFGNGGPRPGNLWIEYYFLSNEIVTPKVLTCPSDASVVRATNWTQFTSSAVYRANAVSYWLCLDGSMDIPQSWLSTDRNIRTDPAGGCSTGITPVVQITTPFAPVAWTNTVHGSYGHVLTTGGSVEFTSTPRLKEMLTQTVVDDNGSLHFLKPR